MWKTEVFLNSMAVDLRYETFRKGDVELEYLVTGKGNHPVLCFHGFGREAKDFLHFESMLEEDEFLVSINLFQHGNSQWSLPRKIESGIQIEEHIHWVEGLLEKLGASQFSMLAYSMGGRIACTTFLHISDRVKKLLLIAPDGFKVNRLYQFAAGTAPGRWIFRGIIRNPQPILSTSKRLKNWNWIDEKLDRFVHVHLSERPTRQRVYDSWLIYKEFQPELPLLAEKARKHGQFKMLFGSKDSVIKLEWGERFQKLIPDHKVLWTIDYGHQLMREETTRHIIQQGLW